MSSISTENARCKSVAIPARQITVCSHGVVHAYWIKFQLADAGEKTPKTPRLLALACGASTSSAPVSILTGADEERGRVGVVGGN
ncbi:hypothetical protein ABVT39_027672 [Epinephelus coioides]